MLWQVLWHEHFSEAEWLSLECATLALHLLWLALTAHCQIFAYRVSMSEAFIQDDSSSESTRGKKHTVSQRCHHKNRLFSWPLIMSADGLGLAYWRFYISRTYFLLLTGQKGESRNENGTETWDFKTRQLNRGRGGRGETDIANQQAKVTGWHQRIPLGL